ncbi:AAA family ATPase [Microbacterium sp. DT81.1]|uniref:AAA family ATPase n=1 Tax=Microbacterium sp. DT81.1 TaxID=3393413 RepID=UPI003CE809A0
MNSADHAATNADPPPPPLRLRSFNLIPATPTRWLIRGWLPREGITVLIGDEGIGKSLWWVHVAAAITTGSALPELGMDARESGAVVVVLTEDTAGEVSSRLTVAGADMAHVHLLTVGEAEDSPTFPDRTAELLDLLRAEAVTAALVVVDVWLDTVQGSVSVKDAQQSATALAPWRAIAMDLDAAVLLIGHTNRMATGSTRDKTGATSTLRKKARSYLFAMRPVDGEGAERRDRLYIGPDKTSSGTHGAAVDYRIAISQVREPTPEDSGTAARLESHGRLPRPIADYLRERHDTESGGPGDRRRGQAAEWLREYMADPDRSAGYPVGSLKRAAADAGFSARTIERAMAECGESSRAAGNVWLFRLREGGEPT